MIFPAEDQQLNALYVRLAASLKEMTVRAAKLAPVLRESPGNVALLIEFAGMADALDELHAAGTALRDALHAPNSTIGTDLASMN